VPHGAQFGKYLLSLSGAGLDSNCSTASCHNGVAPYSDIPAQFGRSYAHPLTADIANNQHQQTEDLPLTSDKKHVHCVDCHNPHQATWKDAPLDAARAPAVNGLLKGVRGVTIGGVAINAPSYSIYEYQICFRCHSGSQADSFNNQSLKVQRVFASVDEGERFNTASAKSYHPVAGPRTGTGLSLLVTANTMSIYCSNCHQPHGSDRPHMLQLANPDTFPSSTQRGYDLCYSCHNENYLMDVTTNLGKLHKAHVFGEHDPAFVAVPPNPYKNYPAACSVCHDPHGVPNIAGRTTATNSLHLINFDLRFVGTDPDPTKIPYEGNPGNPSCSVALPGSNLPLACHPSGMANPTSYSIYPYTPPPL
jgi:predicted CXXCH cytochrome family protein